LKNEIWQLHLELKKNNLNEQGKQHIDKGNKIFVNIKIWIQKKLEIIIVKLDFTTLIKYYQIYFDITTNNLITKYALAGRVLNHSAQQGV
jgi:hypothetical protein